MFYELGVAFLQDRPYGLHVAERRYWQALAIYIDGADYQRQKVVEDDEMDVRTRTEAVKEVLSLAGPLTSMQTPSNSSISPMS
jgi:hypothetical protein